jgi:CheY-like chemotaxis protein
MLSGNDDEASVLRGLQVKQGIIILVERCTNSVTLDYRVRHICTHRVSDPWILPSTVQSGANDYVKKPFSREEARVLPAFFCQPSFRETAIETDRVPCVRVCIMMN